MPKDFLFEKIIPTGEYTHNIYQIQYFTRNNNLFLKFKAIKHSYDDFWGKDYYYRRKEIPDFIDMKMHKNQFEENKEFIMNEYINKIDKFLLDNNFESELSLSNSKNVKRF